MAERPAVRTPCRYAVLRYDANRDGARVKNAYEKHAEIHAKFVPYLVRNSLHLRSVFLSEIMVLTIQYFEDHPQNRGVEKYTKTRDKFVPYLVRNSLHLCRVF